MAKNRIRSLGITSSSHAYLKTSFTNPRNANLFINLSLFHVCLSLALIELNLLCALSSDVLDFVAHVKAHEEETGKGSRILEDDYVKKRMIGNFKTSN
jgi:hypothetical protein